MKLIKINKLIYRKLKLNQIININNYVIFMFLVACRYLGPGGILNVNI